MYVAVEAGALASAMQPAVAPEYAPAVRQAGADMDQFSVQTFMVFMLVRLPVRVLNVPLSTTVVVVGRLGIDNGAPLGSGVAHDVIVA